MKKYNPSEKNELIISQDNLRDTIHEAIGIYMAKEPAERDDWQRKNIWQLWQHLKHELEEIEKSGSADRIYHNLLDAIGLTAMIAYRVRSNK